MPRQESRMAYFSKAAVQISLLYLFATLLVPCFGQQNGGSSDANARLLLGVLEDSPGVYVGETDKRVVRAVFEKIGADWKSLPTQTKSYLDLRTLPGA